MTKKSAFASFDARALFMITNRMDNRRTGSHMEGRNKDKGKDDKDTLQKGHYQANLQPNLLKMVLRNQNRNQMDENHNVAIRLLLSPPYYAGDDGGNRFKA